MELEVTTSGMDKMKDVFRELDGEQRVPVSELFPAGFMRDNTVADSFEGFVDMGPWDDAMPFEDIPAAEWEIHVADNTEFTSWSEMRLAAGREWFARRLTA